MSTKQTARTTRLHKMVAGAFRAECEAAAFDSKLAAAYASQTIRELREAQEVADRENAWVSLYRAILA